MKRSAVLALFFAYLALLGAALVSTHVFERQPYLEDEMAFIYQAKIFERGDIYIQKPEPYRAFWQPFLVDCSPRMIANFGLSEDCLNRRFGKYPPGWPLVLAFGYLLKVPWFINATFAMLNVALVYRLAREIFSPTTGVIASLLMFISPIALLQNATYMSHPSALFFCTLALYGLWRVEKAHNIKKALPWAALGGAALGMTVAIRPYTGFAIALPLVAYSGLRVMVALSASFRRPRWVDAPPLWLRILLLLAPLGVATGAALWVIGELPYWEDKEAIVLLVSGMIALLAVWFVLTEKGECVARLNPRWQAHLPTMMSPLVMLSLFAVGVGGLLPAFSYATTGKPTQNLYELIWDYDNIGFGVRHGRQYDQLVESPPGTKISYRYGEHTWKKAKNTLKRDLSCYSRDLFGWTTQPDNPPEKPLPSQNECMQDPDTDGLSWLLLPLALIVGWRRRWTFVLFAVAVALIASTLGYWIGAGVYSARYFYEATAVLAILSAAGVAGLAEHLRRYKLIAAEYGVYMLLGLAAAYSLLGFSPDRLNGLHRYDRVSGAQIEAVERLRDGSGRPVLIIAYGSAHWREVGALMAATSPYLDSEYVLARDPDRNTAERLIAMFPGYQVVYYQEGEFKPELSAESSP